MLLLCRLIKLNLCWLHRYKRKGVPEGKAIIFSAANNFHGRTIGVISYVPQPQPLSLSFSELFPLRMSTDPESRTGFGPFLQNVGPTYTYGEERRTIRYNNVQDLEEALSVHGENVAAFLVEPIQGEAGYVRNNIIITPFFEFLLIFG